MSIGRWGALVCVAGILVFGGVSTRTWADTDRSAYLNGSLKKLGRGAANILTCPFELIRTPSIVGERDGLVAECTVGIVQGLWRTVERGVVGVFEVVTFYAEIPKGFKPIMTPEFVWANSAWAE